MASGKESERIISVADLLYQATKKISILPHIAWLQSHRDEFLRSGASKLPEVVYPPFDSSGPISILEKARALIHDDSDVDAWLSGIAERIETSARLLSACGTQAFHSYSCELFGAPTDVLADQKSTSLDLANRFNDLFASVGRIDLGAPADACYLAGYVAERMRAAAEKMFGDQAPAVLIVDELSANALAGSRRIRIRRDACFTDRDVMQLINHEAYVHVATSLNGLAQNRLKILGASHPGSTKTQEGLAVFAEFITGSMDIDRFRRLADRTIAIQMAIDGADFIEVYRYFLERNDNVEQAFENARRVFRGGTLTGGAPFTKDIVYLDGLLRVHNFMRAVVTAGRSDCMNLLFCGKLDLDDIPVLCKLTHMGLCHAPKFLPPWIADRRFLLSYLAYSSYLNSIDLGPIRAHYLKLLEDSPPVQFS